jgi:BarA-like signal transduction histidine kinase
MLTSLATAPAAVMSQSNISACLLKPVKPKQLLQTLLAVINEVPAVRAAVREPAAAAHPPLARPGTCVC